MASAVIKIQRCDRCGAEARADTVSNLPNGWSRLVGDRVTKDLCWDCTLRAYAPVMASGPGDADA